MAHLQHGAGVHVRVSPQDIEAIVRQVLWQRSLGHNHEHDANGQRARGLPNRLQPLTAFLKGHAVHDQLREGANVPTRT